MRRPRSAVPGLALASLVALALVGRRTGSDQQAWLWVDGRRPSSSLGRAAGRPAAWLPACAARVAVGAAAGEEAPGGTGKGKDKDKEKDVYAQFLAVAKADGVDAALLFAADAMPKTLCQRFSELRAAATFVALSPAAVARRPPPSTDAAAAPAAGARAAPQQAAPAAPATVGHFATATPVTTLQCCEKCLKRVDVATFNPIAAVRERVGAGGTVVVETVGCLKKCKLGPNMQVLGGVVVDGMTEEEVRNRMFHRVTDDAAVARVCDLLQTRSAGQPTPAPLPAAAPAAASSAQTAPAPAARDERPPPPPRDDREARGQVRDRIREQVANIVRDVLPGFPGGTGDIDL